MSKKINHEFYTNLLRQSHMWIKSHEGIFHKEARELKIIFNEEENSKKCEEEFITSSFMSDKKNNFYISCKLVHSHTLLDTYQLIILDGYRAIIPCPCKENDVAEKASFYVSRSEPNYLICRILHEVNNYGSLNDYLKLCKIRIDN